ncbi:hypothetical protein CRENBAI_010378 [Crenichthys baileyi]|uniref:DUF6729 domain-containing protein n=1 Tax=Crenichthys baileyi TaxID=28760 RepID=A0AAV9SLD8_9TELE
MRERTHGNSITQLYKKLQEEHSAAWTWRTLEYFTACEPFTDSSIIEPPVFSAPPPLPPLPKPKWLLSVYARDVLSRLPEGLAAEGGIAVASSQLPAPRERLDQTPSTSGLPHEFVLSPNRAGQAPKLRPGRRPASATVVRPNAPAAPLPLPAPVPPLQFISVNAGSVVMATGAGHPSGFLPLAPTLVLPATQVALAPTALVSLCVPLHSEEEAM